MATPSIIKPGSLEPLRPEDPRITHHDVQIGSHNYHYMLAVPEQGTTSRTKTVLLCHGWPDTAMTWRHVVPLLTSLHLRVIIPDMLGYGRTSAPADAAEYTYRKVAGQLKRLVETILGPEARVILGGHDWGAVTAWRVAMWHPELVSAVISLAGPYLAPAQPPYLEDDELKRMNPFMGYHQYLASDGLVRIVDASAENLRGFLNSIYDGVGPDGGDVFTVDVGLHEELLHLVGPAPLMSAAWMDYYVREFNRRSFRGPTNWYRTRRANFDDEVEWISARPAEGSTFKVPALLVLGEQDEAVPVELADGMEKFFEGGLRKEVVPCGHWVHWQCPGMVNGYIAEFLASVLD